MLDRLEALDASKDDAGSNTKSGDAIVATLQGADLEATIRAFPTGSTRAIGPFQLTRIFLDVKFAKDATLPKVLTHRFQITFAPATGTPPDGLLPFASNGVPFVFSSFTTIGTITNPFDDVAAGATAQIGPARAGPHHNELPLNDDVITFPKQ